jgi:hypothetical protein
MSFQFDPISFILGMAFATLVWWIIALTRPLIQRMLESMRSSRMERSLRTSSGMEIAYLKAVYKQTQGMHLAASLFSLDEIVETPQLLAPPILESPDSSRQHLDIVEQTLPYLPDYPELGSFYNARTLTLNQALAGGMHIAILGQPGRGKSTALAYLAARLSKPDPEVNFSRKYIPFLVHVADLGLPLNEQTKPEEYLDNIIGTWSQYLGVFDAQKFPKFVKSAFASGEALLLLDGVDELPQSSIQNVRAFLQIIQRAYPDIQVVLTGAPEYLDGLPGLGFAPLAIMPWNPACQAHFLQNWTSLWDKYVTSESWAQQAGTPLDTTLLNRWLNNDNFNLTPLEFTLKVWGAYAGDIRSASPIDTIEAHIKRLTPAGTPWEALIALGFQAIMAETSIFDHRRAREWTKSFEPVEPIDANVLGQLLEPAIAEATVIDENLETGINPKTEPKKGTRQAPQHTRAGLVSALVGSGLMSLHAGGRIRFIHPVFQGYLAGKALGANPSDGLTLLKQPAWAGQTIALRFMAAFGDVSSVVNELLRMEDPVLKRPVLKAAQLLRDSKQPRETPWRVAVMSALVQILQDDDRPLGLRGEAMTSLALNGDSSIGIIFRQLTQALSDDVRRLAALGSGLTGDAKAVDNLVAMVTNSPSIVRQAALLALVEIGTPKALETVAVQLLHGDEQLRVLSAEALANHPTEGHEALREGIHSEDILVRRAIVFGLSRVNEAWSADLLEQTQHNDEQWAVRNVAVEFLNVSHKPDPRIPHKLSPPHETPWLIEFAGKYGMGISPARPATDIFLLALKDPNKEVFNSALAYLRNTPSEGVLAALYPFLFGTDLEARESVFQALTHMARSGVKLPDTRQYGLG